jgi:hypothetical protein
MVLPLFGRNNEQLGTRLGRNIYDCYPHDLFTYAGISVTILLPYQRQPVLRNLLTTPNDLRNSR